MTNDKLIGIGIGLLVGWWLWRRRFTAAGLVGAGNGGACCGGCVSGAPRLTCPALVTGGYGTGNYAQATGPMLQGSQV